MKLCEGDVISLDQKCSSAVEVRVENKPYYYGMPGIIGKNYGVQMLDFIDKDVESYE